MKALEILQLLSRISEALACAGGFLLWRKWKGTPWRWFTIYLLFVVLGEAFGKYTLRHHLYEANRIFFNYFEMPLEFVVVFLLFYATAGNRRTARLPVLCGCIFLVCWLTDTLLLHRYFLLLSFNYMVGAGLLVVLALRFLIRLAGSNEILTFRTNIMFWVCTGWLLFYVSTLPYYGLRNTLHLKYPELYHSYTYLTYPLITIMYLLFLTGFLCGKPRSVYSSSSLP